MSSGVKKGKGNSKFESPDQFDPERLMYLSNLQGDKLGVDINDMKMEARQLLDCDYQYTVNPVNYLSDTAAMQKLQTIFGVPISDTVDFERERFDIMRQRIMGVERKEKRGGLVAFMALYRSRTAKYFRDNCKTIDHAAFEKLLYPKYLPTHSELMKGLGLKAQMWYSATNYADLEMICREPLDRVTIDRREGSGRKRVAKFTFEEFYNLFWGHYAPFNLVAFLSLCTSMSSFFCQEFINGIANYLAERLELLKVKFPASGKKGLDGGGLDLKAPILLLGPKTGQLARFINATGKLPVEVLTCCEEPETNPYSLMIPAEHQRDFRPYPVEKIKKWEHALDKYKPSIVLTQDLASDLDQTKIIQGYGHVQEYLHVGMPMCYLEGQGWETWGLQGHNNDLKVYKETGNAADRPSSTPPFEAAGFYKRDLPHLSKWLVHKLDSDIAQGTGAVTSWSRKAVTPGLLKRLAYNLTWRFK